jgi:hypothetical protein
MGWLAERSSELATEVRPGEPGGPRHVVHPERFGVAKISQVPRA